MSDHRAPHPQPFFVGKQILILTIATFLIGLIVSFVTWIFPDFGKHLFTHVQPNSAAVVQAATALKTAANDYKAALTAPYEAAIGGQYLPKISLDTLIDKHLQTYMENLDLMDAIPNVITVPENQTQSIGSRMCDAIADANQQVEHTLTEYNSKIPDLLYSDIAKIRDTTIHQYFYKFVETRDCTIFSGMIRYNFDKKHGTISSSLAAYPIPHSPPHFSASDYLSYTTAVRAFSQDAAAIASNKIHIAD